MDIGEGSSGRKECERGQERVTSSPWYFPPRLKIGKIAWN